MPTEPVTSISKWNRSTKHVEANIRSGRYINAETALVFVGPPRLSDVGGIDNGAQLVDRSNDSDQFSAAGAAEPFYPVGLVEQLSVQQFQNVQKMFEIGSRRSYQAGGRVQVSGSLGRVMFNGPSLLRVLYSYYPNDVAMANGKVLGSGNPDSVSRAAVTGASANSVFPQIFFEAGTFSSRDPNASSNAGDRNSFFINLMSELFSHPFGMGVLLRDNNNRNYGAFYIEDCFINSHNFSISSSSTLITEGSNFQADAVVPLEYSTESDSSFQITPLAEVNS